MVFALLIAAGIHCVLVLMAGEGPMGPFRHQAFMMTIAITILSTVRWTKAAAAGAPGRAPASFITAGKW